MLGAIGTTAGTLVRLLVGTRYSVGRGPLGVKLHSGNGNTSTKRIFSFKYKNPRLCHSQDQVARINSLSSHNPHYSPKPGSTRSYSKTRNSYHVGSKLVKRIFDSKFVPSGSRQQAIFSDDRIHRSVFRQQQAHVITSLTLLPDRICRQMT